MSSELVTAVKTWLQLDKNVVTKREIEELFNAKKFENLEMLLQHRMEFGTAGLRARMGPGYSQMNDLTILQTSQGLLTYIQRQFDVPSLNRGVVLGYDGRYNSKRWATLTANVMLQAGIPVYLYSSVCPTPFVAFGVRHFKCLCGVMVTASHNPKEDNGYKVYWSNGAQIIPPHDTGIANDILLTIEQHKDGPDEVLWNESFSEGHALLKDPMQEVMYEYFKLQKEQLCYNFAQNSVSPVKFVYTAMHGVGHDFCKHIFEQFNLPPFISVKEQEIPDPEFPTVKFPNPEEGKSSLDYSIRLADAQNCQIILANDPDADRLAVAEKLDNGQWKILTGNEIGALLGWWLWKCFKHTYPDANNSDIVMLSSTVSSKILQSMAKVEGFQFLETLTGFKWMGNKADELLRQKGKRTIFAFEEAIGFMCGSVVLDKDGVSAIAVAAEMIRYVYAGDSHLGFTTPARTLMQQLEHLYTQYGYHVCNNSYYFCYEAPVRDMIFHHGRHWSGDINERVQINGEEYLYPARIGNIKIVAVRDLTVGFDSTRDDKKPVLPVSSSSHMITFQFDNGATVTIRTSGTEPKIKWYSELITDPTIKCSKIEAEDKLNQLINAVVQEFYQPDKHKLKAQSN